MKKVYLNSLILHDVTQPGPVAPYFVDQKISGLGFPEMRLTKNSRSGAHGAFTSAVKRGGRTISLTGMIQGPGLINYGLNRRALAAVMRAYDDNNGVPVPVQMEFITDDGLDVLIKGSPLDFQMDDSLPTSAPFSLSMYCPYADFLKAQGSNFTITPPTGGGVVIPVVIPVVLASQVGGQGLCVNYGTAETFPLITLTGPLTNPTIQNITTGDFIKLNMTIAAGQVVVIDTFNRTVVLNGVQSVLQNKSSDSTFFELLPVTDSRAVTGNLIILTTTSVADNGNILMSWQDAYIGI